MGVGDRARGARETVADEKTQGPTGRELTGRTLKFCGLGVAVDPTGGRVFVGSTRLNEARSAGLCPAREIFRIATTLRL